MFNSVFEEDPFFSDPFMQLQRMNMLPQPPRQHTRQSNNMVMLPTHPLLTGGLAAAPLLGGGLLGGDIFSSMDSMMRTMNQQMNQHMNQQMNQQMNPHLNPHLNPLMNQHMNQRVMSQQMLGRGVGGGGYQSSYTSITINGDQVHQTSASTTVAANGVKETKRTERDTRTGVNKIAIGHHIGDRAHIIEKSRNSHSGQNEESQEFVNIQEDEAGRFNDEFKQRINQHHQRYRPYSRPNRQITYHQQQ